LIVVPSSLLFLRSLRNIVSIKPGALNYHFSRLCGVTPQSITARGDTNLSHTKTKKFKGSPRFLGIAYSHSKNVYSKA
jgi:hypothetical protein